MARVNTKQATTLCGVGLSPGRVAFVPDDDILALRQDRGPKGDHLRRWEGAGLLEITLDGQERSARDRRIAELVDETLRVEVLASTLSEDEREEARQQLVAKRQSRQRVQRRGEANFLGGLPDAEPSGTADSARNEEGARGDAQSDGNPSGDEGREGAGGEPPATLKGLKIDDATPLIEQAEDPDLLELWKDTDDRKGIRELIDLRLEELSEGSAES